MMRTVPHGCIVVGDTTQTDLPDLYSKIGVAQVRISDVDRNLLGSITDDVIIDFLVSSPLFELLLKLCEEGTEEIIPDPLRDGTERGLRFGLSVARGSVAQAGNWDSGE